MPNFQSEDTQVVDKEHIQLRFGVQKLRVF